MATSMAKIEAQEIIDSLLAVEHENIAKKLSFISKQPKEINNELLNQSIGLIDTLSRKSDEASKNIAVYLIAMLWEYKKPEWSGLKEVFILFLSRMGFAPTATMTDEGYKDLKHSTLQSYITEMMIAIHQANNEVQIQDKSFLLTEFQKEIWDKIDQNRILGISAPTSAGKTFIILLKIIDLLIKKDGTVVYIVPNLSLMSQVSIDTRRLLKIFNLENYEILTSFYSNYGDSKKIFVLTQERAIAAFSQTNNPFPDFRILVVDEIQNIEKVAKESDQRSKILFDAIFEFSHQTSPNKIIISGPMVRGIEGLTAEIFKSEDKADKSETKASPVVNFTYSITKQKKYILKQYSNITGKARELTIESSDMIAGIGGLFYGNPFNNYLYHIISSLKDNVNIVFSPTSRQARKTALDIYERSPQQTQDEKLRNLIEYIAASVNPNYDLCKTLTKNVAYHHGKLPSHIRRVIEQAFSEKVIQNLTCTTTLMQGVNLPVQNMIVRNPNLYVKNMGKDSTKLSGYEFANLRGRAGRLLKDFIGRAFVLDEKSFYQNQIEEQLLFDDETKELKPQTAYSDMFSKYEKNILDDLSNNVFPLEQPYHYLLPYIRQTIYKYGDQAISRFDAIGIHLNNENFEKIKVKLKELVVPVNICYKNRYWDPLHLDLLFREYNNGKIGELPTHSSRTFVDTLCNLLLFFNANFSYYCRKYHLKESDFIINEEGKYGNLLRICLLANQWLNESTLFEIFQHKYYKEGDISDKIDTTISVINDKVSYGISMLLKPLADFNENNNMILNYIEMGTYHPTTRKLIELGVPRETAILLKNKYFSKYTCETEDEIRRMLDYIKRIAPELDYWIRVQLESIIG